MAESFKIKELKKGKQSKWRTYANLTIGSDSIGKLLQFELTMLLCSDLGGALGFLLRSKLYPRLFKSVGKNVIFGKGLTLRHPSKICIGDNVVIDDHCVLDAKGDSNQGIRIGNDVFLGRNNIVYCKNGDITLEDKVNIGANSIIYSKNAVTIGADTMIAAYAHVMSGGQYNYRSKRTFYDQSSHSLGPTTIGKSCWLGSQVVVQDGISVGDGAVLGSGAVVVKDIPSNVIAVGVPAKVLSAIEKTEP